MSKPTVAILGGLGFIGRNLVQYLLANELAEGVRVVDKRGIMASFLPAELEALLDEGKVEYVQADLSEEDGASAALEGGFDVVFNCCAETKSGMEEGRYAGNTVDAAKNAVKAAAAVGVKRFVHFSTAGVYKPSSKPCGEDSKLGPTTAVSTASLRAEEAVQEASGVARVILRPAVVYGPGDESGLMPRLVCSVAYMGSGERMDFLWDAKLKVSTVHVLDVVRAAWLVAASAEAPEEGPAPVFNLADGGDTDQGRVARCIAETVGIETGFVGTMTSRLAAGMGLAASEANKKHMGPWIKAKKENKIMGTPLSPFIHEELLQNNHLCVDGARISETLGFKYRVPELSAPALKDMLQKAIAQNIFPATVAGKAVLETEAAAAAGGGGGE